jgi:hypothetical protein
MHVTAPGSSDTELPHSSSPLMHWLWFADDSPHEPRDYSLISAELRNYAKSAAFPRKALPTNADLTEVTWEPWSGARRTSR